MRARKDAIEAKLTSLEADRALYMAELRILNSDLSRAEAYIRAERDRES